MIYKFNSVNCKPFKEPKSTSFIKSPGGRDVTEKEFDEWKKWVNGIEPTPNLSLCKTIPLKVFNWIINGTKQTRNRIVSNPCERMFFGIPDIDVDYLDYI